MKTHRWTLITAGILAVASIWLLAGCSQKTGGDQNAATADNNGVVPSYELSDSPVPVVTPQPVYPEDLRKAGTGGTVLVAVIVDADSSVAKAWVTKGVEGYPALDEAALAAVKQWRFRPGEVNQKPVKCETVIPVTFTPDPPGQSDQGGQ
jgi:TonB family protein